MMTTSITSISQAWDAAVAAKNPWGYLGHGAVCQSPVDVLLAHALGKNFEDAIPAQVNAAVVKLGRMMRLADVDKASADELNQLKGWLLEQS